MSKTAKVEVVVTAEELRALMTSHAKVTIRKMAAAAEVSYAKLHKSAKAPEVGIPYDPDAVNYQALANVFNDSKVDPKSLDWEMLNTVKSVAGTLIKDMTQFEIGKKVYLRRDNEKAFEIIFKTKTHIVLLKEDSTEPRAWKHETFLFNGPVFEPRKK